MARFKVTGTKVIAEGGTGPIKSVWIAHGAALALFEPKLRNSLMRESLIDGGNFWTVTFLHLRFDWAYAPKLGYQVSGKYETWKSQQKAKGRITGDQPLVFTGLTKQAALSRVKVTATATANKQTLYIAIPIPPHGGPSKSGKSKFGIAPIVGKVLRALPRWEIARIAEVVEQSLTRALQGAMEVRYSRPDAGTTRVSPPPGPARERHSRSSRRQVA